MGTDGSGRYGGIQAKTSLNPMSLCACAQVCACVSVGRNTSYDTESYKGGIRSNFSPRHHHVAPLLAGLTLLFTLTISP